jgi:hypothetical protein
MDLAKQMNIRKAERIINHVSEVVRQWPTYAKKTNVDSKLSKAIKKTLISI